VPGADLGRAGASTEPVRIERVEFVDAAGDELPFAVHREPVTVRIWFDAERPVGPAVFGIALYSANDVHIAGTNTQIDAFGIDELVGRGHVDFRIDSLVLTPGEYELTAAIHDERVQHAYDRREREFRLSVREGARPSPVGFTDLLGSWTGPTAADAADDPGPATSGPRGR